MRPSKLEKTIYSLLPPPEWTVLLKQFLPPLYGVCPHHSHHWIGCLDKKHHLVLPIGGCNAASPLYLVSSLYRCISCHCYDKVLAYMGYGHVCTVTFRPRRTETRGT
jgi:hypothetical protein